MKRIYLAVPYSGTAEEREYRFNEVNRIASILINKGNIIMSPISQGHPIALAHGLPTDWKYWQDTCRSFIDWCDVVYILCLDGWKESVGILAEIEYANGSDKEFVLLDKNYQGEIN